MSENSENFANGISTHNLSHFPITEIKKYQNHTKFTQNLSVNFSVIFPFYSKNSYSITHKITPTNPKTTSKNSQTSHKSTVFSESNHFLIIMHSFSYSFLPITTLSNLKTHTLPIHHKSHYLKQISYLLTLLSFLKFQNLPKLFTMTHIFNQIHTQKKNI